MDHSMLAFEPFGTAAMFVLAAVVLALAARQFPTFVRRFSKSIADFKRARDEFEDRHGL